MSEPVALRKARAMALKLAHMPDDLWEGQLIAGSMTLEAPRLHAERGFPDYLTAAEHADAERRGLDISCFGHIVPDYPKLLDVGLAGIRAEAAERRRVAAEASVVTFFESVAIAIDGVLAYAERLAARCAREAELAEPSDARRSMELRRMAENLRVVPRGPARTFWQALQSVWLLHMVFHSTMDGNAMGRADQYLWPLLERDLRAGSITVAEAAELVDCFTLKFNERAKTTEEQMPEMRSNEPLDVARKTRHGTSSQLGSGRDRLDATNHWLQNIVVGGIRPDGTEGENPLSHLLLRSYDRNKMTNPLLTVRVHQGSPASLVRHACEVMKAGGGMPAVFNDDVLIPALCRLGIPQAEARDYTNDGCWEVIIPGRTDFRFQRLSLMLCLEWALNRGVTRVSGLREGLDTGDPRTFRSYRDVWEAFLQQVDAMVGRTVRGVIESRDDRSIYAPVPLLSALIDGTIRSGRDMTAGGAAFRTFGVLAEGAAHAIDSLTALKTVVFADGGPGIGVLCDALEADFAGFELLRKRLASAPKYGNDEGAADDVGREVVSAFCASVERHAAEHRGVMRFPCGVGTFSWYIGIGEGLGPSPDGRRRGEPVSSNFSPALGRDLEGIPPAILSYGAMGHDRLPAGGPLDLRIERRLVGGPEGTDRMEALVRGLVETGGSMMTLTVADTEELRAAQAHPELYKSLRVRMGGWCAYFTMLSTEQQNHHIRRQEGRR